MRTYIIKKGSHCSNRIPRLWFGDKDSIIIDFRFTDSCWFPMLDNEDFAINKLAGFSYGFHRRNSIRVGWRPSPEKIGWIELYIYTYSKGERKECFISNVECGQTRTISINYDRLFPTLYYSLTGPIAPTNGSMYLFQSPCRWGYYLFPYFGGKKTAPHDIKIDLGIR